MKTIPSFIIQRFYVALLCALPLMAQESKSPYKTWFDIAYARESAFQKLDVYVPTDGNGPFPVILHIHGGAFRMGDKRDGQEKPMLEGLKRGYAVVSINYSLSAEAKWPAQINDCKAAVRWIRAHPKEYNLDPQKIAAWGASAGGHLSAILGTSGDVPAMENPQQGSPDQSSRVQAVVDWFGPTDFLKMDEYLEASKVRNPQEHSVEHSPESQLIGKNIVDAPTRVQSANPETYISADDPPFYIQHGLEDPLVPYQGSVELARKLGRETGWQNVRLELFPATEHGGKAFETAENIDMVFRFLDEYLKKG